MWDKKKVTANESPFAIKAALKSVRLANANSLQSTSWGMNAELLQRELDADSLYYAGNESASWWAKGRPEKRLIKSISKVEDLRRQAKGETLTEDEGVCARAAVKGPPSLRERNSCYVIFISPLILYFILVRKSCEWCMCMRREDEPRCMHT